MIVLDASVLIAQLDGSDAHHELARELLLNLTDGLGASVVTLAETLVAPARAGRIQRAEGALNALGVKPIGIPADAAPNLALLRAETGLRMPDCCVLHAAQLVGASMLATFDQQLARAADALGLDLAA